MAGVTSNAKTEYTPTLINTSWTIAMIAPRAICHSKRQLMKMATRTRKITSARTAFSVMDRPQDELTEVDATWLTSTFAALANCSWTAVTTVWS